MQRQVANGFTVILPPVSYHQNPWEKGEKQGVVSPAQWLRVVPNLGGSHSSWHGHFWYYLARGTGLLLHCEGLKLRHANLLRPEGLWYSGEEHGLWNQDGLGQFLVLLPVSSMSLEIYLTSLGLISLICIMGIMVVSIY